MKPPLDRLDADEREALRGVQAELEALRKRHENDPPLDLLRAGHHDALPPELQADVTDLVSKDAWSRALLEGLDEADMSLSPEDQDRLLVRIQKKATQPKERPARWRWMRPALAASALAVVFLAVWSSRSMLRPSSTPSSEQTREMTAVPPAGRQVQLPLDKPEMISSAAALTWRGASSENQLLTDLKP